jgi:hypothetical protein
MATYALPTSHPLEIPQLIITPSTPTDDTPLLANRPRLNAPRNQPLLQVSHPTPITIVSGSSTAVRNRPVKESHCVGPYVQSYPLERSQTPSIRSTSSRIPRVRDGPRQSQSDEGPFPLHGRGTVASLILITAAFLLVMASVIFSPDTIVRVIREQQQWAGEARKSFMTLCHMNVDHGHTQGNPQWGMTINSFDTKSGGVGAGREHENSGAVYKTAGPVMSHDAWKLYLKKRQQMMGQGQGAGRTGPSSHLEAWDFH